MTLLELLRADLEKALEWNQNAEVAPVCLLWPDEERLFESGFERLAQNDARFYSLGEWDDAARRGPSYWLKWKLDSGQMDEAATPIWYLGGVSRAQLRPEDNTPNALKPLCELLFRGKAWAHLNGKDWTPLAWLLEHGVDVAGDPKTRESLLRALPSLWNLPLASLRGRGTLVASDFDELLNPEPIENLLGWMNDPAGFRGECETAKWNSFVALCESRWSFSPPKDGPLGAAERLVSGGAAWEPVWNSFERNATRFEGVVALLETLRPPETAPRGKHKSAQIPLSFADLRPRFPGLCAANETVLRQSLMALEGQSALEARQQIAELEQLAGVWRASLWARLGHAPLALALQKLSQLASRTQTLPAGATATQMAQGWADDGWQTDALVWQTLAHARDANDFAALKIATRTLYADWLDAAARAFSERVVAEGHTLPSPGTNPSNSSPQTVWLFADGLRFDLAQSLRARLETRGLSAQLDWTFGALPGVTPTAKPAVTPLPRERFGGGDKLHAQWADGRKVTAENLRGELQKSGLALLHGLEVGNSQVSQGAWTECGSFDSFGHQTGAELAHHLKSELDKLAARVTNLLDAGWREVQIVTDHGWLLLPGGLSKVHLPEHLTDVRKGRCARLKDGQECEFPTVFWHWDAGVEIAVAPGARCFEEGKEYEHGGLSLPECVLPRLCVTRGSQTSAQTGRLGESRWVGLRLRVEHEGGAQLDLRSSLADAASSLCGGAKDVSDGKTALLVEDDRLEGTAAHLVLLNTGGEVLDQLLVTIGG